MSLLEIFELELQRHNLKWCRGCERDGHKRGFVLREDKKTVHLDRSIATRSTLHRGLHEIAHCVNDETGMRRFQKEAAANQWAEKRMRELGIPVPRKKAAKGKRYVARMKRWGNNIRKAGGQ